MIGLCGLLTTLHLIFDFPLQGEFLAIYKNPTVKNAPFPWYTVLGAHAFLHASAVGLVFSPIYGLVEFVFHFLIDMLTCHAKAVNPDRAHLIFNLDQLAHISLKFAYVFIYYFLSLASLIRVSVTIE